MCRLLGHGATICGWLLPGPYRTVPAEPPRFITPWPAVVPLPYIFVWFDPAEAHVHLFVSLSGLTPGLLEVFGVPLQPLNLSPPGVSFVCESADGLLVELAEVFDCVFDCACSAAFAC